MQLCGGANFSPRHGASSRCGWRNVLQYGGHTGIYGISGNGQPKRGGSPAWRLGEVLTTPRLKTGFVTKHEHVPVTYTDTLVRTKQRKKGHVTWYLEC